MKILLTGSSGFIGTHITPLLNGKHELHHLTSDLLNHKAVQDEVASISPDIIVHLAARTEVEQSFYEQVTFSEINYVGTVNLIESAAKTGTDRIELYTEFYAVNFSINKEAAVKPYIETAKKALEFGLGINAGHDLDLINLKYFAENVPGLLEVSIGHALICDSLEYGMSNTIKMYLNQLK